MSTGEYISLLSSRPQFTETTILLAVMDGEVEAAEQLIAGMLPGEVLRFATQLTLTSDLVQRRMFGIRRAARLANREESEQ